MKMTIRVLALVVFTLVIFAFGAAVNAGDAVPGNALRDPVWQRYLSPAEHKALAAMAGMVMGNPPADATPAEVLEYVRNGFADMVREFGAPRRGQTAEPYSKDGVSGLWIRPRDADAGRVLLYFHGGGYILGSAETGAPVAGYLAHEADILAFSLDYPLAPESPYPAQLDNAESAYAMLLSDGFRPENIVVAGDSAGGNLTLALLLRLREKGTPLPAAAYLISPWGDVSLSLPTHTLKRAEDFVLSDESMEWFASSYTAGQDRKNPFISPVNADLAGFPPLLIQAGSFETLLDDSLTIARNAALADVPVRLSVWPGYGHDFQMFFHQLKGAEQALEEAGEFLEQALDGTLLQDE